MSDFCFTTESQDLCSGLTTLDVSIIPEQCPLSEGTKSGYFKLRYGKGEKNVVRKDLLYYNPYKKKKSCKKIKQRKPLATFVQITDVHIIDAASPARASFLAAYLAEEPALADTFRPYEAFSCQVMDRMVNKINNVKRGPHLKEKISMVINTGDNSDGKQKNELQNYINLLDGKKVVPNPATPGKYVGVQDDVPTVSYEFFYHPNCPPSGVNKDNFKLEYGYPEYPNILDEAAKPFKATGLNIPWYTCNGNHDDTKLGVYSLGFFNILNFFNSFATGQLPEYGSVLVEAMTPNQAKLFIRTLQLQAPKETLELFNNVVLRDIPESEKRLQFTSADFISAHFSSTLYPGPIGHGFTEKNIEENTMYYTFEISDQITGIMLDTCNPSGNLEDASLAPNGAIGSIQISWFEQELRKRHSNYFNDQGQIVRTKNKDKLIMIFSHHTSQTLNNNFTSPTTFDNDPQRIRAEIFIPILHRYPNIIAWVNGHEHRNKIRPFPDPKGNTQGFWEINTASHIDYPQESRIVEVSENNDNTLSIFCTIIDHESNANVKREKVNCCGTVNFDSYDTPKCEETYDTCENTDYCDTSYTYDTCESTDCCHTDCCQEECKERYSIEEIASISRELSYNDPFIVKKFNDGLFRTGTPEDRNVELLIYNPLKRN